MQIGAVFPQTEIGADVGAVRAYTERVEQLGFAHILAYDHVVGADPAVHSPWRGPYDISTTFHEPVTGAGLAPMPIQQPIPIWLGGSSPAAYRRAGKLADGWFPQLVPGPKLDDARAVVDAAAREAGRDPAAIGMEGRVTWSEGGVATVVDHVERWRAGGASHLSVNTMGAGFESVDAH